LAWCPKSNRVDLPLYAGKTTGGIVAPRSVLLTIIGAVMIVLALLVTYITYQIQSAVITAFGTIPIGLTFLYMIPILLPVYLIGLALTVGGIALILSGRRRETPGLKP